MAFGKFQADAGATLENGESKERYSGVVGVRITAYAAHSFCSITKLMLISLIVMCMAQWTVKLPKLLCLRGFLARSSKSNNGKP